MQGVFPGGYVLATIHRPSNTDQPERLAQLLHALKTLPLPVVLPVHPRLRDRAAKAGLSLEGGALCPVPPVPYAGMVVLARDSAAVVTDSGGLQKEAYILGRPCTTLKGETEWLETLEGGWNVLQPDPTLLARDSLRPPPQAPQAWDFGDGRASERVVDAILRSFDSQSGVEVR